MNLRVAVVGLVGFVFALVLVGQALRIFDGDPSVFLHVGSDDAPRLEYAEGRLGEIRTSPEYGHDGKFFFIQAHDPFLTNPSVHAAVLDRPTYRSQRALYPLLAFPGLVFGEWGLVWALLAVNVAAIGLGSWATAGLARAMGTSPWWGLAFAFNPGVLYELIIGGAGVVAWALAVAGLWALLARRNGWAIAAMTGAVLAREVMLVVAVGAALYLWRTDRRRSVRLALAPLAAAGLWAVYVRLRLGVPLLSGESQEIGAPLAGLLRAAADWPARSLTHTVVGLLTVAVLVMVVVQAARRPSVVTFGAAGFPFFALLLTRQVWFNYFDVSRAVAPVFTTFALVLATEPRRVGASGTVAVESLATQRR